VLFWVSSRYYKPSHLASPVLIPHNRLNALQCCEFDMDPGNTLGLIEYANPVGNHFFRPAYPAVWRANIEAEWNLLFQNNQDVPFVQPVRRCAPLRRLPPNITVHIEPSMRSLVYRMCSPPTSSRGRPTRPLRR
jgi:hypothetical protein